MKTVITSTANIETAKFDQRFGRCAWFCVYNEQTKEVQFIENENKEAKGGAGTKSAEKMIELGVKKIISGDFGPKAKDLLSKFKVQMVIFKENDKIIKEIIETLNQ